MLFKNQSFKRGVCAAWLLACAGMALDPHAALAASVNGRSNWVNTLQGRDLDGNAANGDEAYYDRALNITWLADANYAKTSGYDADGLMNWHAAQAWATNLNVHGITGWRLPTMVDTGVAGCNWAISGTDCGYNVSTGTSELAHIYYVTLGNLGGLDAAGNGPQSGWGLTNTSSFKNVQSGAHWFGVEYAPYTVSAWRFDTYDGRQGYDGKHNEFAAWAVHSGDVAAVPEPQTCALALAGLTVAALARRRRAA